MQIDKVKAIITSLCLFICSGFFFSFLLLLIYLLIVSVIEEHSVIEALTAAFVTPGLICMAFASLFYTLLYKARCKSGFMEYLAETSKISVKLQVQYRDEEDNNGIVETAVLITASVVAWALSFMLLIILIGGRDQDLVMGSFGPFQVLLSLCDIVMFLLAVLLSASCICGVVDHYCRGTEVATSSPTSMENEQPFTV